MSAVVTTALPQIAYAAPATKGGDDKGIVDTVKGWFSDDDGPRADKPPSHDDLDVADRQKLPKGKNAPKAHRVKELKSRRTSTARFWQMSNGQVEAELSALPTSYRDAKTRSWKSIDTSVNASKAKGYAFANTTNSGRSWFGRDSDRLVRFQSPDGRSVTLGLDGASRDLKPTAKGPAVTYKDATRGADLQYAVGPGRVKENITLAERPDGPLKFTFTLDTHGLVPKARKDGSIALYGELPHTPELVIPAPYMTDAKKADRSVFGKTYSTKVTQRLTRDGTSWKLTVTPDAKWLAARERQYPVVIDPTITLAPSPTDSQDTMVLSDQASTNFDTTWKLSAGKTDTGTSRSLIKFPLSEIPSGTKIDSARLEMYFDQAHTTNANDVTMGAYRATGAWDETTATWTNTSGLVGELSGTSVQVDDGDAGTTAATGTWPTTSSSSGIGSDYRSNKDSVAGDAYTWQPKLPETASYRVDAHYVAGADRASNAPYTVTSKDPTATYTVNQQSGTNGVWASLNGGSQINFSAGTTGKVVLGDGPASTSTSVIADAVRWVNPASIVKNAGEYNQWHKFPVTDTVQQWLNGTSTNNGFVLKATDESSTAPTGGPRYESGDGDYGGETATVPRLTVTYGKVGTTLNSPTVVHSTGPELSWKAYANTTGDPNLDIVEYQLHRSTQQAFTPSAATLVAPIDKSATAYTDTTATPTPDSSSVEIGRSYYYQLAVKTKDGQLLGSPTRIVGVPKAGRTMRLVQGTSGVTDTTLSSGQPTTNEDTIASFGVGQKWLEAGNNSTTYGKARAVMKFDTAAIPTTATVLESRLFMWGAETTTGTNGAIYELHGLNKDFNETQATWNNATSTTAWTTAGGDYSGTVSDTVAQVSEVGRHWWDATSLTQGWAKTPSSNHGALVKLKDETTTGPQERTLFLASEAADPQLGPLLRVIYVDSTTDDTYYAPRTPSRMTPNSTYTVDFTVTNTTSSAWASGERVLSYTWKLPDGTDVTTGGNQASTAIPALSPGQSATIQAQVNTPINSDSGSKRTQYVLGWDVKKVSDGSWLSVTNTSIQPLKQNVAVEDPTSDSLGLEKFYSYTGKNTGAGASVMNNLASGNTVWSYNAFTNPGRGLTTFARFAYNSLDTDNTTGGAGAGWSAQLSGPIRLGAALDFHPNPVANATEIRLPDGDGTTHVFTKQADGSWKAPAGVHYKVTMKSGLDCTPDKDPVPDAWTLLRPDGTRFLFGCDGYLTSVVDKNGNTQTYTYEQHKTQGKAAKFLAYVTDPAGRQSLTLDYYKKGDASYEYIDGTGAKVTGTSLTDPDIYDHVKSITDISGRKISFYYTVQGLLGRFTDGDGSTQPKAFKFTYDATQGNKNVKLVTATDPRGKDTKLVYYAPQTGDDPKYHWWTKTITDRLNGDTGFAYAADTANTKFTDTTVTDAETHATKYVTDDFGRPVQTTNAKSQVSKMSWDADNNVTYLEEDNGAKTAYCYDQKTGYPLWQRDAENNKSGVPDQTATCVSDTTKWPANAAKYEYQTRADGFSADLFRKTSLEGRAWQFGYDSFGNLKTVTDPKGVATATAGDYTTSYEYDSYGELTKATDANGNPTTNSDFGPTGYPNTITDALNNSTTFSYDERGQVTQVTDADQKVTTQTYDTFGRPLVKTAPKAAGVLITTPAPEYDANDNITTWTAPNGAVSTAVYDAGDQMVSSTDPKDTPTGPERRTDYTYDKAGNLKTTTEPKGTATTTDTTDYVTTHNYDEIYQPTSVVNSVGDKISYQYDNVGNLVTVIDPKKNASTDPADYTSKTAYDLDHRAVSITDALGKTRSRTYDKDSLVVASKDAENNETLITYDERGKQTEVKVPHEGTTTRSTKYEYDQVGNVTKVITPRGAESANADDFTSRTEYDALNRPVKEFQPYDPADARYNDPNVYTETTYDKVGRVSKTSMPPSEGQTVRNDTTFSYFDNGWTKSSTDPWDIVTTYDYNELGRQTARTLTSAGGSSNRTMSWTFYPDGKLKSKTDDGVPVGSAVPLVDNSDTQNTNSTGTWTKGDKAGQQGYDHQVHAAGTGTDAFTWTLNIPKDGTYTAYVKYPQVTGAATTAKYKVTKSDGTTTDVIRDQNVAPGTWVSLGSFTFTQGNAAKLQLFQNSAGAVVADGVKLVRDNSGDTDNEKHTFAYAYDVNGNLTSIDDTSPGAPIDAYTVAYTGLDQIQKVTEALAGQEKKSTSYTYDADGQPETVTHPDQFSKYTYDARDLTDTISVGKSPTDASPQVTSYTYTDRGQVLRETKANDNTVDSTYFLDGALKSTVEKKANGTLVASHTYDYDANGNQVQDVARKMNADNHSAYLDSTTDYTYDPVDRLAKSVKTGNGASTDTYVHDDNSNVISQTVQNTPTTFTYDRNRLQSASVAGTAFQYNYDPFGRQESVTSNGKVVGRSVYDGFDHVVESQKMDGTGTMKSTKYSFDPLDRTLSKTADGKTTDYEYLGLSSEVLDEKVAGQLSKSFQYSPWGERLSQVKQNTDGTTEDTYYSYNSHTDVDALTDKNGDTKATYGYTAYGSDDTSEFTGIDKPDAQNPAKEDYNPYRYNGKRWDAQSGTYDMGFRDYSPGLNRFTTRDMYTGALADMGLGADPFTGNRYAFGGGNPVSNVEVDGHFFGIDDAIEGGAVLVVVAAVATYAVVTDKDVSDSISDTFDSITSGLQDLFSDDDPEPEPEPAARPRPGDLPGGDTGTDNKKRCESEPKSSRFQYQPLDGAGRAQGATALLCPSDYKPTGTKRDDGGKVDVYGFPDPAQNTPRSGKGNILDRVHIVGDKVSGDWVNENLFTGFKRMNRSGMRRCEIKMEKQLAAGKWVMYTGKVNYSHTTGYADGITMSAYTEDGPLFSNVVVQNSTDWQTTC